MAATANNWYPYSGKWKIAWFPKTASTLISNNVLVQFSSGQLIEATTTAGANQTPLVGINIGGTQAAADATTALIPVLVPADPFALAIGGVDTGTPNATTDLGKPFDISATGGVTVSTSTHKCVTLAKYLSATQGIFKLESVHPIVA